MQLYQSDTDQEDLDQSSGRTPSISSEMKRDQDTRSEAETPVRMERPEN